MRAQAAVLVALGIAASALLGGDVAAAQQQGLGLAGLPAGEPFSMSGSLLRMLGGLLLCIGAFTGGMHVYRKHVLKAPAGMRRRLSVLERVSVSQKGAVLLVALDGKEFLVTTGADSPRILPAASVSRPMFDDSLDEACASQEGFNA